MTNLTKNLRTHKVIFKDWRDPINITKEQYEIYSAEVDIKKYTETIKIEDIDTKRILFNWRCWEIKEFIEREYTWAKYNAICDYWNRHPIQNWKIDCKCKNNYWYYWFELKMYVAEKYWIIYPQDITPEMRKEFYLVKNNKNIPQN